MESGQLIEDPKSLEKEQPDQQNDDDPGNCIREDDADSQPAIGRVMLLQQGTAYVLDDHHFLPGKPFRDERLVSCS
jgi:hypothetical protein